MSATLHSPKLEARSQAKLIWEGQNEINEMLLPDGQGTLVRRTFADAESLYLLFWGEFQSVAARCSARFPFTRKAGQAGQFCFDESEDDALIRDLGELLACVVSLLQLRFEPTSTSRMWCEQWGDDTQWVNVRFTRDATLPRLAGINSTARLRDPCNNAELLLRIRALVAAVSAPCSPSHIITALHNVVAAAGIERNALFEAWQAVGSNRSAAGTPDIGKRVKASA